MQVKICIIRGFQRLGGDKAFTSITILGNIVISLVLGSIFFNLLNSTASFYGRDALLFVVVLFNALTSALEVLGISLLPSRVLTFSGPASLCRPSCHREARFIRIVSPVLRSNRIHDLRTPLENYLRPRFRPPTLFHGTPPPRSRASFRISFIRLLLHPFNVDDVSNHCSTLANTFTGNGTYCRIYSGLDRLHGLCAAH